MRQKVPKNVSFLIFVLIVAMGLLWIEMERRVQRIATQAAARLIGEQRRFERLEREARGLRQMEDVDGKTTPTRNGRQNDSSLN
jgi:hypothetical protein